MSESADDWQRLSPRNLLIDPIKVLGQFGVPAAIAIVGISTGSGRLPWWMLPVVVLAAVAVGVLPWLTTFYRITETHFQIRSGVLNKKNKRAPLDRVRSVDLEATLLQRIVGLTKVEIGTGVDDDRITLDSVSTQVARSLRSTLLAKPAQTSIQASTPGPALDGDPVGTTEDHVPVTAPSQVLAEIDWAWLRFAPFDLGRLVLVSVVFGLLSQFGDDLPIMDVIGSAWTWVHQFALALVIGGLFVSGLTSWVLVAVTGYIVQWWQMRLTRSDGSLQLTAGLFTTRSITVEEKRVRGIELKESALLRLIGGGQLSTLATGVGSGGVTAILPPCPVTFARSVGGDVLDTTGPLTVPLVQHGAAARRRCWTRELREALVLSAIAPIVMIWVDLPLWVPISVACIAVVVAAVSAETAYQNLGHALTSDHLVVGSGSLTRVRTALELDGIIGWVVHQSWFQRRLGLATLTATTAAGAEEVVAQDIPLAAAIRLADDATPSMREGWVSSAA